MKVKIFNGHIGELEKEINKWLADAYAISVTEILQTESAVTQRVTITIFYIGAEVEL